MPTTLLDNETWEQAYQRRFVEEAEIDRVIALKIERDHMHPQQSENMLDALHEAKE